MSRYDEIMQKYVNMSFEDLLSLARVSLAEVIPPIQRIFAAYPQKEDKPSPTSDVIIMLLAHCLGADDCLTELECRFVNLLLDSHHSCNTLMSMITACRTDQTVEILNKLIVLLDPEAASNLMTLALCILAADETITRKEFSLFRRLLD